MTEGVPVPFRRRGFTTVELMVAISIIILLGGILLFSINSVLGTAKTHATKVQMENAVSLLQEFELSSKLNTNSRPAAWWFSNTLVDSTNPNFALMDFWHVPDVFPGANPQPKPAFAPILPVTSGSAARDGLDTNDAIIDTVIAFQKFQSNSNVRAALAKIPADKQYLLQMTQSQFSSLYPALATANPALANSFPATLPGPWVTPIPILLDAWNNPIIFVPASGLGNLTIKGTPIPAPLTSPDKRPFFASAGPDGNFQTGEDNVYSFEK